MQTVNETGEFDTRFVDSGLKSFAALSKGFQAISLEMADYSRHAVESASVATENMLAANSLDKAIETQTDYMKTAYEGFIAEATRIGDLCADMARDACLPFEAPAAGR